jgi:hypothetical protein
VILGDAIVEGNEQFYVNLSNPVNALLGKAQSVVTLLNDDAAATWASLDSTVDPLTGITASEGVGTRDQITGIGRSLELGEEIPVTKLSSAPVGYDRTTENYPLGTGFGGSQWFNSLEEDGALAAALGIDPLTPAVSVA